MAQPKIIFLGCIILLLAVVEATSPVIANHPSKASCKIKKYKMCYNLEQDCPKFCPDSCEVECASCKPICSGSGSSPAPEYASPPSDSESPPSGEYNSPPPEYASPPSDSESPPSGEYSSPPPEYASPPSDSASPPSGEYNSPPPEYASPPSDSASPPSGEYNSPPPEYASPPSDSESYNATSPGYASPPSDSGSSPYPSPSAPTPTPYPSTPATSPSQSPTLTPSYPPSSSPSTPTSSPPYTTPNASSPYTPGPPQSPPTAPSPSDVASKKRVRCKNKNYGQCYNQEHVCPASCPTSCEVDCASCKPVCSCDYPGAVCQDPRFIGGNGITFYFHGKKDENFCLVTDPNLHINAHFIGKRNENMTRDFTWVQSIGILFDNHNLFLGARKTSTWDGANDRLALTFDGEPIFLEEAQGSEWQSNSDPLVTITRAGNTNNVNIEVQGKLKITAKVVPITEEESRVHNYDITKDDCFAHLDLGFKFHSLSQGVDGVLGKTYRDDYVSRVKMGVANPIMGGEKEYASSSLFATDCLVSRFQNGQENENSLEALELGSMSCGSGMNGEGVVCKR